MIDRSESKAPRRIVPFWLAWGLLAGLFLGSSACSRGEPTASPREDKLVLFAASSLRDVFTELGHSFEAAHPGVKVSLQFAGTQELRRQIEQGAVVDVFASADEAHMQALVAAKVLQTPTIFAQNELVVVVSHEAALVVREFSDLPLATRIVIGDKEVPIGRYTQLLLDRAQARLGADFRTRIESHVVSRELNVRHVLAKVSLGEAQAGVVYKTDILAAAELRRPASFRVVSIPAAFNVVANYPLARAVRAPHPQLSQAWLAWVSSAPGQAALKKAGFTIPRGSVP